MNSVQPELSEVFCQLLDSLPNVICQFGRLLSIIESDRETIAGLAKAANHGVIDEILASGQDLSVSNAQIHREFDDFRRYFDRRGNHAPCKYRSRSFEMTSSAKQASVDSPFSTVLLKPSSTFAGPISYLNWEWDGNVAYNYVVPVLSFNIYDACPLQSAECREYEIFVQLISCQFALCNNQSSPSQILG
jgi:hypothetical protein